MPESINAQLAVMRSAFSTATAAAKVPDGKCTASIGAREAACNVQMGETGVNTMVFVLQPNIAAGLAIYSKTEDTSGPAPAPSTGIVTTLGTTSIRKIVTFDAANKPQQTGGVDSTRAQHQARPDRFRLVSAALRLSCVNTAQFNGGWFEAVRVATDYQILAGAPAAAIVPEYDVREGCLHPNNNWENGVMSSDRWPNHPSYVTGKLSDLYKHQFYLQPQGDRDFVRLNQEVSTLAGFDTCFDSIVIRIHVAETAGVTKAIHWHTVHHHEMIYDPTSDRCRYHSHCFQAPRLVEKVDNAIKKDPKASIIRSPNSYGVNPY
jgi:hypothetical protein